jgi:hypothetical protein
MTSASIFDPKTPFWPLRSLQLDRSESRGGLLHVLLHRLALEGVFRDQNRLIYLLFGSSLHSLEGA